MKQHLRIFMALLVFMICGGVSFGQTTVTDELTKDNLALTASYAAFSGKSTGASSAEYTGVACYGTTSSVSYIQMKWDSKNAHGGIYTTKSGGIVKSVKVEFYSTGKGAVSILGKETAFDKITDKLHTVSGVTTLSSGNKDTFTYTFKDTEKYEYVGIQAENSNAAKISKITIVWEKVDDGKTETSLTFPITSYTFDKNSGDKTFTNAAVLNPAEAGSVTYKSSNEDLAVVSNDGSVLVSTDNIGTATITASFAGNDKYRASEASYTIEVKGLESTFDFTKPETYGYSSPASNKGTAIPEGSSMIAGDVAILNVNNGTTETRFWNANNKITFRIYKNAKLQITVPNGYAIYSITTTPDNSSKYTLTGLNTSNVSMDVKSNITNLTGMTVVYIKLPTASLTTAASGFSTYAADYAVNYTEAGLKAYAVKVSDDKTKVTYTECTGVVPAGKAVLVKGTASTSYSLTPAAEDTDATFDTDLQISDGNVTADGTTIFAFGTKNDVSGFKIVKSGVVIPEKKGYLVVANASAAKDFFAFDDSTNGIDDPTIEIGEEEVPLFNLAGQRVGKDYKGIVVKNGKKYVNK